jgi:hypothetical protein
MARRRDDGAADRGAGRRLALALAGTAERRAAQQAEIEGLARSVDHDWLASAMDRARLLPLLGTRLVAAAPDAVPSAFADAVQQALVQARRRAILVEQVALRLTRRLGDAGIPAVILKGPQLAQRLYGDVGMRASNDVDLLVAPHHFHAAIDALEGAGYRSPGTVPWIGDLPLFESSLQPVDAWRPPIDLHWRLHWYETSFSRDYASRCEPDEHGVAVPRPVDELAALLLFWCRDGLAGLRHVADVGAWWDRHGSAAGPPLLDGVAAAYPALRRPLAAAALLAERAAGVPASRLLSDPQRRRLRTRLALRLANLVEPTAGEQAQAGVVWIDGLLTERGDAGAFVQRHLVLPGAVVADIYRLPPQARRRRTLARAYYGARRTPRLIRDVIGLLVAVRHAPR